MTAASPRIEGLVNNRDLAVVFWGFLPVRSAGRIVLLYSG